MTKQLFQLAAMAVFATCLMALTGSWHPKTYTVVQRDAAYGMLGGIATAGVGSPSMQAALVTR